MNATVKIGKSEEYTLSGAVMLYGKSDYNGWPGRHPFATFHTVNNSEGEPMLAPGQLVTPAALAEMMKGLGFTIPNEILPEHVLARSSDVISWWSPAKVRTMFFDDRNDDPAMLNLNGKHYPQPPLIFRVAGSGLWVRALAEDRRPTADTPVLRAPYWNTFEDGSVCLGSSRIPATKRAEQIYVWEESFFASEFTHGINGVKPCAYRGEFLSMWKQLQGKKSFPSSYLAPLAQTVKQFVEMNNDDDSTNNGE